MGISTKHILKGLIILIVVALLVVAVFLLGTMIGYGTLGDGNPKAVFNRETWTHIADFFK